MKKSAIFCTAIFSILFHLSTAESKDLAFPVFYPEGSIGTCTPYFIWYDAYNERDNETDVEYKITIKPEKGPDINPILFKPKVYDKYFYYFKFPFPLQTDDYNYTIERMVDSKTIKSKYFHYLEYPVTGEFSIIPEDKKQKDNLAPEILIEYLKSEKKNRLENGYNFIFFSSAGAGSFGIGLLFYRVFDFGLISKVISLVAFSSSAVGLGAAGYYGYNYLVEKNNLRQKVIDIGRNVSINGNMSSTNICADFKLSF